MSLTVTQRPISGTSKWNGVATPILYKMTRKDFAYNQINNSSSFAQVQINGSDLTGSFTVGDSVYLKSDNAAYDGAGTVTARSFSGGNTLVTISIAYNTTSTAGYINNDSLRPGYYVETALFNSSNVQISEALIETSPNRKGEVQINVSRLLSAYLSPDNTSTYSTSAEVDNNAFIAFYIKYREVWVGSANSQTSDSANVHYAVNGAMQIPSVYGGNMREYVIGDGMVQSLIVDNDFSSTLSPLTSEGSGDVWTVAGGNAESDPNPNTQRLRLTEALTAGTIYRLQFLSNYPDTIDVFVAGSSGAVYYTFSHIGTDETFHDIIFTPVSDQTYIEIYATGGSGDTFVVDDFAFYEVTAMPKFLTKFNEPVLFVGYPFSLSAIVDGVTTPTASVKTFNIEGAQIDSDSFAITDDVLNRIIIKPGDFTWDNVHYIEVFVYGSADPASKASEVKRIYVRTPCENPVVITGRNSLGGDLIWCFDFNQEQGYVPSQKRKRVTLFDDSMTINEWEAVQDFITDGLVYGNSITEFTSSVIRTHSKIGQQLYDLAEDGSKVGVISLSAAIIVKTRNEAHAMQLEIEYPTLFLL